MEQWWSQTGKHTHTDIHTAAATVHIAGICSCEENGCSTDGAAAAGADDADDDGAGG